MVSLADLFNPSFFIILGIVTLLIALVVVYFESKMREQNHKIASMLSLVSTLAEDMNGVKMGLNHLAITTVNGGAQINIPQTAPFQSQNFGTTNFKENSLNLIEVSDDESDDNEDNEEIIDDSDLEEIEDEEEDYETTSESDDEEDNENIKVIKLNISETAEDDDIDPYEEANNLEFEPEDDLEVLEDLNDDEIPEISKEYTEELLSLKYDEEKTEEPLVETVIPLASELKTISINLGDEHQQEHIDFKKLQLPKLRSIAVEKGLTTNSEAQKLKKPELLKLLGAE
jgi:hypothetical protein